MVSTLILDLETSALEADRGIILCGVAKSSETGFHTIRTDETNPKWKAGKRGDDSETVARLAGLVEEHDIVVAHYGRFFDVPFLRTRQLRWGMRPLKDVKLIDPFRIARNKFKLRSNGLASIADHVGLTDRKTPLYLSVWMEAILNGSKKAMDEIVEHCVADVNVLEGVLRIVKPFIRVLDSRGSDL